MPQAIALSKRLTLRYENGQFSFSRFDPDATNEQLYELAGYINSFQEDAIEQVIMIQAFQIV